MLFLPARRALARPVGRGLLLLVVASLIGACAQLPQDVVRPVSHALSSTQATTLARLVNERRPPDVPASQSGFLLLSGATEAYGARLALVEAAQKTLDLQYYAIHADASTARLFVAIRQAGKRGVRVRILLDDLHSAGHDAVVMGMAFVPNIEMRVFNPLAGPRGSAIGRYINAIDDARRLQQRMHNKLFIADNVMAVTGGRNLGDAYFDNDSKGNFVDLDVLSAGPITSDFSRSFDDYWNNDLAYPVQSLVTEGEQEKPPGRPRSVPDKAPGAAADAGVPVEAGAPAAPVQPDRPSPEQRAHAWNEQPLDLRQARYTWAPAIVVADRPAKIASAPAVAPSPVAALPERAPGLVVTRANGSPNSLESRAAAANATAPADETVVDGLLKLFDHAKSELTMVSPYFVPGPDMKAALAAARARGVRIRVLTNSLASNDAAAAHAGYARHRMELLAMGVELYEMRSEQGTSGLGLGSSGSSASGASRSMLHSKVLVADQKLIVIGSMNLDLRSQLQNTEVALLIRDDRLARAAAERIDEGMRRGAWHVENLDGTLTWQAPEGSGLADTTTEPDTSLGMRLMMRIFGPLAPDKLL